MEVLRGLAHDLKKKIRQSEQNLFKMQPLSKIKSSSKNDFKTAMPKTHQTQQNAIAKKVLCEKLYL